MPRPRRAPRVKPPSRVELPHRELTAPSAILIRVGVAVACVLGVTLVAYLGRDGYVDAKGDDVSFMDALYYATVSVTTTGYGDVRPESDMARAMTTFVVTPLRLLFLIVLVGTTVELLAGRTRELLQLSRWRRALHDHVIICGFGTKGRAAAETLRARDVPADHIVVVDEDPEARRQAQDLGMATVAGTATVSAVLEQAGAPSAAAIIVAPNRDDTAVLMTLTARQLNPHARIAASVREEENAVLLRQSGADIVITSSGAAGRLLGLSTQTPRLVEVLEDLLSVGTGLDVVERTVGPGEEGPLSRASGDGPVLAVIRGDRLLRFDDPEAAEVRAGDRVVCLCSNPG